MSCFGINLLQFYVRRLENKYKQLGLSSKLIQLEDGATTIHCWVPDAPVHKEKPSLMLVHGFGMDGCTGWENQVAEFSKEFAVYVPDLLFFGKSTTTSSRRSESFQAECLAEVLVKEGVQEAFVVGTSYGGFVAFRMAELSPGLIKKVVIADSGVCMDPSSNDSMLQDFNAKHVHEVLMPITVKAQKQSLRRAVYKAPWFLPNFLVKQLMEEFVFNRDERIQLLDGLVIGTPAAFPLPKLSQEVLVLWGREDRIFSLQLAEKLQEHLGENCKLAVIPESGHVPQLEKANEFNQHILSFFAL